MAIAVMDTIRLMVMMPDGYPHRKKASRNSKVIIYAPTPSPAEGVFCYQQKGAFYRAGRFSLKKNIYICFRSGCRNIAVCCFKKCYRLFDFDKQRYKERTVLCCCDIYSAFDVRSRKI